MREVMTDRPVSPVTSGPAPVTLSVVITSYNYERFIASAIDSALSQPGPVEVIVVDDCSKDNSRAIISGYGDRIIAQLQDVNSGHGAGLNSGFARASGDLVMFLDADDFLLPDAVRIIRGNFDPEAAAYLYRMRYADEVGALSGMFPPLRMPFASGDISALVRARGRFNGTITSGMVFSRARLARLMPMSGEAFRQGGDGYLSTIAPLYGTVRAFDTPISAYRLHGAQHSSSAAGNLAGRARWRLSHDQARYDALRDHAARLGLPVASDLGTNDRFHVRERLISLIFDPDQHPYAEDRIRDLLRRKRRLSLAQIEGNYRFLRAAWWILLEGLPPGARRRLFSLEVSPQTRPAWFGAAVRMLRKFRGKV